MLNASAQVKSWTFSEFGLFGENAFSESVRAGGGRLLPREMDFDKLRRFLRFAQPAFRGDLARFLRRLEQVMYRRAE